MKRPAYVLQDMRYAHLRQVVEIDRQSFPNPWSFNTYRYEVNENSFSHMAVLTLPGPHPLKRNGLHGLLERLRLRWPPSAEETDLVLGFGGFWLSGSQAHISTIAVRPRFRGMGLGELLLAAMIRRAIGLYASMVSLEVRVSNTPALHLYHKYEFAYFGVKTGYYRDNDEDAYDLRIEPLDAAYRARFDERWTALRQRIAFVDRYTAPAPAVSPAARAAGSYGHP